MLGYQLHLSRGQSALGHGVMAKGYRAFHYLEFHFLTLRSWISYLVKQIPKSRLFILPSHSKGNEKTRGRTDPYQHFSLSES